MRWTLAICTVLCMAGGVASAGPDVVSHNFGAYPAPAYRGPRARPDFSGPGRGFLEFRSRIRDGFAHGQLFAGRYVLIGWGCGAGCVDYVVGDVTSGRIWRFPISGEDYFAPQVAFRPTSRLVQTQWDVPGETSGVDDRCMREDLVWNGRSFVEGPVRETTGQCPIWPSP